MTYKCPICLKKGLTESAEFETETDLTAHRIRRHPEQENVAGLESAAEGADEQPKLVSGPVTEVAPSGEQDPRTAAEMEEAQNEYFSMLEAEEMEKRVAELETRLAEMFVELPRDLAILKNTQTHLTSEIAAVRDSLARLASAAALDTQSVEQITARLSAQEQQTFGERIRRLEEEAGIVPKRPDGISGGGAPHREPAAGEKAADADQD